jgi:hypothetical protein
VSRASDGGDGVGYEREHGSVAGVKEPGLLVVNEYWLKVKPVGPTSGTNSENR